jgi:hypothetical protein
MKSAFVRTSAMVLTLSAAALGSGCGEADEFGVRRPVSGAVTLNGEPVKTGRVLFVPLQSGPAVNANLVDGRYAVPKREGPVPGSYRVEIYGEPRPTGKKFFDGDSQAYVEATRDSIPPEYNLNSTTKVEIKPDGDAVFDYDLTEAKSKTQKGR